MSPRPVVLAALLAAGLSHPAPAQPARVGQLPLLAAFPSYARCTTVDDKVFNVRDSVRHRLVGLALDPERRAFMFNSMMTTQTARRTEGETVTAWFTSEGAVKGGNRTAYAGGTPERPNDQLHTGLLAADTAALAKLVASMRKLCHL